MFWDFIFYKYRIIFLLENLFNNIIVYVRLLNSDRYVYYTSFIDFLFIVTRMILKLGFGNKNEMCMKTGSVFNRYEFVRFRIWNIIFVLFFISKVY